MPWDEESKMEGNYPSARGRERQDSPWLASQCCYAVVRSEGEGGKERWWWVGGGSEGESRERGLADCGGGGGLICSAVCRRSV